MAVTKENTIFAANNPNDEHHHWTSTSDGTLVINKGGAYYVAAIDDTGCLLATDFLAHDAAGRDSTFTINEPIQAFDQYLECVMKRGLNLYANGSGLLVYIPSCLQNHGKRMTITTCLDASVTATLYKVAGYIFLRRQKEKSYPDNKGSYQFS